MQVTSIALAVGCVALILTGIWRGLAMRSAKGSHGRWDLYAKHTPSAARVVCKGGVLRHPISSQGFPLGTAQAKAKDALRSAGEELNRMPGFRGMGNPWVMSPS